MSIRWALTLALLAPGAAVAEAADRGDPGRINPLGLTAGAALTGYYYGVRDDEERPQRPAYQPGAAVNLSVGLADRYAISQRWGTFLSVNHTWLDPAIADSPIVSRDRRWSGVTALTCTL